MSEFPIKPFKIDCKNFELRLYPCLRFDDVLEYRVELFSHCTINISGMRAEATIGDAEEILKEEALGMIESLLRENRGVQ